VRAFTGGETSCPQYRAPKTARTAQKISSVPLSMDEIRFRMCGATVYEISRLGCDTLSLDPSWYEPPPAYKNNKKNYRSFL
jgi:hypothetical protein